MIPFFLWTKIKDSPKLEIADLAVLVLIIIIIIAIGLYWFFDNPLPFVVCQGENCIKGKTFQKTSDGCLAKQPSLVF